ncbi:MAG: carboxypeptidase-like regulatory domain-containing protein [Nitrospirota bacterium]
MLTDPHDNIPVKIRTFPASLFSCLALLSAVALLAGCGGGGSKPAPQGVSNRPGLVSMKLLVTDPSNTSGPVTLRTGMIFGNENDTTMTLVSGSTGTWEATISAPEGTILRYTYRLNGDWDREESYEHRQGQFHFREVLVVKNAVVNDTIACWEGSLATGSTGTLIGTVTDQIWQPVMGAAVSAGPYQTMTRWDGSYSIKGVPAGPCSVTVHTDNGEYQPKMAEATVPAAGTATKDFMLASASSVTVTFRVTVPVDTPANAVPRIYGDAYRLGMFPVFEGSAIDPSRAIDLTSTSGRTWTYAAVLGKGSCYQYRYTLGDFRINHERDAIGADVVRSFCVTGAMTLDDTVVS